MPRRGSHEAKEWASSILDSPEYQLMFWNQIRTGTLPSNIQSLLYHYRYGKPREEVHITEESTDALAQENLSEMSMEDLAGLADRIAGAIRAGRELEALEAAESDRKAAVAAEAKARAMSGGVAPDVH